MHILVYCIIQQLIANKKVSTFRRAILIARFVVARFGVDLNTVQRTGSIIGA